MIFTFPSSSYFLNIVSSYKIAKAAYHDFVFNPRIKTNKQKTLLLMINKMLALQNMQTKRYLYRIRKYDILSSQIVDFTCTLQIKNVNKANIIIAFCIFSSIYLLNSLKFRTFVFATLNKVTL